MLVSSFRRVLISNDCMRSPYLSIGREFSKIAYSYLCLGQRSSVLMHFFAAVFVHFSNLFSEGKEHCSSILI